MRTFKKNDLKNFKRLSESTCSCENEVVEEVEEIDELVTPTGGSISGDEKAVSNSEIKTAPQNTTDDFNAMAIQPNRYLYGVTGSAYSTGTRAGTIESVDKIANDKFIELLENVMDGDMDNDLNPDMKALRQSTKNKLDSFLSTISKNGLSGDEAMILLNQILDTLLPLLSNEQVQMIKEKLNA